jgi:hypothetical protein
MHELAKLESPSAHLHFHDHHDAGTREHSVEFRSRFHALQAPLLVLESRADKTFKLRDIRRSELLLEAKVVAFISGLLRHAYDANQQQQSPSPSSPELSSAAVNSAAETTSKSSDALPAPASTSTTLSTSHSRRDSVAHIGSGGLLESLRGLSYPTLRHRFFHTLSERQRRESEVGICRPRGKFVCMYMSVECVCTVLL